MNGGGRGVKTQEAIVVELVAAWSARHGSTPWLLLNAMKDIAGDVDGLLIDPDDVEIYGGWLVGQGADNGQDSALR